MTAHTPAIRLTSIAKRFGPVEANRGASLEVATGEIHALVGENGAGKSTLMRILAGMFEPDSGTIEVNGQDVTGWGTSDAIASGVGMVHQHFMLVPTLTVAENVILGSELTKGLVLDRAGAERAVSALAERTGLEVAPERTVADLSVGEAQRVEILKTIYRGARILILDEPTAVLSPPEVRELWRVLRRIRDDGGTIVLITHKLDEVIEISEMITVMRAGATVGRMETKQATPASIARAMVGRDVALASDAALGSLEPDVPMGAVRVEGAPTSLDADLPRPATRDHAPAFGGHPLLEVSNLTVSSARRANEVDDVSFAVSAGEILGIAGVEGNGQTELIEAITGLRPIRSGTIRVAGRDITSKIVKARTEAGLSHIPEDRHRRGLILDYSVADNLILGVHDQFSHRGVLDRARIDENAARRIQEFDVRPPNGALPSRALSGGNQQKVVIAREMGRPYSVLVAAQPTRGVDVGAIEFIHTRLREARAAGKGILLFSADLVEILALSDRVAVMYGGRIVAVVPRRAASPEVLGPFMTGAAKGQVA